MHTISGHLVAIKSKEVTPYLLYGAPEPGENTPTEQFLLNGLVPLDETSMIKEAVEWLRADTNTVSLGLVYFEMEIADSLDEVCYLREHPGSVFLVDCSEKGWSQQKIFGPRTRQSKMYFDNRSELVCNGFETFSPITKNRINENPCIRAGSEWARQTSGAGDVKFASWQHRWVTPITSINQ